MGRAADRRRRTVRLPRLIGEARALDLILTGRAVGAREALSMGLVNRVVPKGQARMAAECLAQEIASFPQTCLRNDRRSVYQRESLAIGGALAQEFALGLMTLASGEAAVGSVRFSTEGKGKSSRCAQDDPQSTNLPEFDAKLKSAGRRDRE
jgi:enoyl-CoA hydratase